MTRLSRLRRVPAVLALVAALVVLSGCFKVSQDVEVRGDGSGSVTLHAEINKKALAELFTNLGGLAGVTPDLITPFRSVNRTFPDGTKVRAVDSSERATLDASFDFSGPDEYRRKMQEVNEAVAANPDASLPDDGSIDIRRVRDLMEVKLDPGSFTAGTTDLPIAALSGMLEPDAQPEVLVTITMPGPVLTSNGQVRGRTVTWDLLGRGAPATLTASSEVDNPGAPTWALALGVGLILLVLVVTIAFFVSQRRHRLASAAGPEAPEWSPTGHPGTGSFFPPEATQPATGGWPVPPPRPPAPTPVPTGPPPWQPSPWSVPPAVDAPPAPWSGPPTPAAPPGPSSPPVPSTSPPTTRTPPKREPTAEQADAAPTAEIPVTAPVPGWYADPAGGGGLRYWDGAQWTPHTR